MSSSGSSSFQCPKCFTDVSVRPDQAGTRIDCPFCGSSLFIPENVGGANAFDDLFDDKNESVPNHEENPNTMSDESELDTGILDGIRPDDFAVENANPVDSKDLLIETDSDTNSPVNTDSEIDNERSEIPDDPFEYKEDGPLKIDGISEELKSAEAFYIKCKICNSELQVLKSQVGTKIVCSDCHSEIPVLPPERKSTKQDHWRQPAELKPNDADDELKLQPAVERPEIDYGIEKGFGLDEIQDDLLAPVERDEDEVVEARSQPKEKTPKQKSRQRKSVPNRNKAQTRIRASNTKSKTSIQNTKSAGANSKPLQWKHIFDLELLTDLDLVIRTIVVITFLTFAYAMFDSVWAIWSNAELDWGEKIRDGIASLFGAFVCFLVVGWFMTITFSVLMRSIANGFKKVDEWVGFAPSEWLGSFVVVFVSYWAAMFPGVLFGYFLWQILGWFFLLPFFAAVSGFALMPIFLISSFYNQSAFNIFSPGVVQSLNSSWDHWAMAYKTFAVALGIFVFGLIVVSLPSSFFCLVGATIQVFAITLFSILIGLHAKTIADDVRPTD